MVVAPRRSLANVGARGLLIFFTGVSRYLVVDEHALLNNLSEAVGPCPRFDRRMLCLVPQIGDSEGERVPLALLVPVGRLRHGFWSR